MIQLKRDTIPEIVEYLKLIESDTPRQGREQHALKAYIEKTIDNEALYFDKEKFYNYLKLEKYFNFKLFEWQKFLIALWLCTYQEDKKTPRWKTCFGLMSRGAGKDGFIAYCSFCLLSYFNTVKRYDVDVCATVEEQAMRPVCDVVNVLENPEYKTLLNRHYYHTKQLVQGRKNGGIMKGRTSNPASKDGMRSGVVIFNEVHAYLNYDLIKVFRTGLGKVAEPRIGIFSSNGDISDGPLDDYLAQGNRILFEGEDDRGFLPFICRVSKKEDVDDPENWSQANPSWQHLPHLRQETQEEYLDWKTNPERNGDFLAKRMGIRAGFKEISVTDYEKILNTNKPLPDLAGLDCTVGIDYAELSDWASCCFHFKSGQKRYDIVNTWICTQSKTIGRVNAPWSDWCSAGYCVRVDDPTIAPELITGWIMEMGKKYNIKKIGLDSFRWALMSDALKKIGFDSKDKDRVKLIRPSDIMKLDPVVQNCFDTGNFIWGNNPALRWAVNNVKRVVSSKKIGSDTGNYYYAKIEGKSRKTDPWMALAAAMCCEDALSEKITIDLNNLPPVFVV